MEINLADVYSFEMPELHYFDYPNLNKIQTFLEKPESMPIPLKKGLDF